MIHVPHTQELRRVGRRADKRKSLAAVRLYRQLYILYLYIPIEVRALPHRQQHPPCRRWQLAMNFVAQTFLPCCRQNMPEVLKLFHLILGIYILYITVYILYEYIVIALYRARKTPTKFVIISVSIRFNL